MKLRQIMPILLALTISVSLSACENKAGAASTAGTNTGQGETSVLTAAQAETTETEESSSYIEVYDYEPASGEKLKEPNWEDFNKITICGREFDMPCKIEDFDGDFECAEGNDGTYAIVYNNDVVVMFNYYDKGEKNQYSYMYSIYEQGVFVEDIFSFENYNPNMSVEELFHAFGRPSKVGMKDNKIYLIEYVIEDFRIRFHITNKDNNSYTYMITCFVK